MTDPIESLMTSAVEIQRTVVKASLTDRELLEAAQNGSDVGEIGSQDIVSALANATRFQAREDTHHLVPSARR